MSTINRKMEIAPAQALCRILADSKPEEVTSEMLAQVGNVLFKTARGLQEGHCADTTKTESIHNGLCIAPIDCRKALQELMEQNQRNGEYG